MLDLMHLPLNQISESPLNTRKYFNQDAMYDLTESIKAQGVLQPILVRPLGGDSGAYQIVAGARRYRAAMLASLETIPCVVRALDDRAALEATVVENLQREDIHPIEEAEGYERLMQEAGYNADSVAEKVGKSRSYIYGRLKLLQLCQEARDAFYDGKLDASTALLVARIPGKTLQNKATKELIKGYDGAPMSFRTAKDHVRRSYMLDLKDATFRTADANLVPAAGSCKDCPKRTGNDPELFGDVENTNVCTDPACFENKRQEHYLNLKKNAEKNGVKVIEGTAAKKIMPYGEHSLNDGYVSLDSVVDGSDGKTYRDILGKAAPVEAVIENSGFMAHKKPLIEIASETALEAALKKAGFDSDKEYEDPEWAKQNAELKAEREAKDKALEDARAYRKRLFNAVRDTTGQRYAEQGLTIDDLRAMARNIFRVFFDDLGEEIMGLHNGPQEFDDEAAYQAACVDFSGRIDEYDVQKLGTLLADLCFVDELHCMSWDLQQGKQPTALIAEATRLGLDVEALKNETPPTPAAQAQGKGAKKSAPAKAKAKAKETPAAPSKCKKTAAGSTSRDGDAN